MLKCPCCGKSLYGNIAKAHSKDKYTRYYYYCKNTNDSTGHRRTFRTNIEQKEINKLVADIICATVRQPMFAEAIEEKIGKAIDTSNLEKQLEAARAKLRVILGTKTRLEQQLDSLDESDPHFRRKNLDLQRRYEEQYDLQEEAEEEIEQVQDQIRTIRQEQLTGENIYRLLYPSSRCIIPAARRNKEISCERSLSGSICIPKNRMTAAGSEKSFSTSPSP